MGMKPNDHHWRAARKGSRHCSSRLVALVTAAHCTASRMPLHFFACTAAFLDAAWWTSLSVLRWQRIAAHARDTRGAHAHFWHASRVLYVRATLYTVPLFDCANARVHTTPQCFCSCCRNPQICSPHCTSCSVTRPCSMPPGVFTARIACLPKPIYTYR